MNRQQEQSAVALLRFWNLFQKQNGRSSQEVMNPRFLLRKFINCQRIYLTRNLIIRNEITALALQFYAPFL